MTIGDLSLRMLESAKKLLAEHGCAADAQLFPAESMPFPDVSFDLVTVRVAPHHFSSPPAFLGEVARVLKPGGHFLLIDGAVPDDDPETGYWLNRVEKWRDGSHVQLIAPSQWRAMVEAASMQVLRCETYPRLQPDLGWYFETARTPPDSRRKVLDAIRAASPEVRRAMQLKEDDGRVTWQWTMVTLLAQAP
ncbi:MAG: class I SAM-dependent methyltransferase [Opitutaceae bacterium]